MLWTHFLKGIVTLQETILELSQLQYTNIFLFIKCLTTEARISLLFLLFFVAKLEVGARISALLQVTRLLVISNGIT